MPCIENMLICISDVIKCSHDTVWCLCKEIGTSDGYNKTCLNQKCNKSNYCNIYLSEKELDPNYMLSQYKSCK